jgi:hypothetical protein
MTAQVKNRLENYKFGQARQLMAGDEPEFEVVDALAELVGNVGYALEGKLGVLVEYIVDRLLNVPESGA